MQYHYIDSNFVSELWKNSNIFQPFYVDYDVTSLRHDYQMTLSIHWMAYNLNLRTFGGKNKLKKAVKCWLKIQYMKQKLNVFLTLQSAQIGPVALNVVGKSAQIGPVAHKWLMIMRIVTFTFDQ